MLKRRIVAAFLISKCQLPDRRGRLHPDTGLAWSINRDLQGIVWDVTTGKQLYQVADGAEVFDLQFTKDGQRLLYVQDEVLRSCDAKSGMPHDFEVDVGELTNGYELVTTPHGSERIVAQTTRGPRIWKFEDGSPLDIPAGFGRSSIQRISPDSGTVCIASPNRQFVALSLKDGQILREVETPQARNIRFTPDSKIAIVIEREGRTLTPVAISDSEFEVAPD